MDKGAMDTCPRVSAYSRQEARKANDRSSRRTYYYYPFTPTGPEKRPGERAAVSGSYASFDDDNINNNNNNSATMIMILASKPT